MADGIIQPTKTLFGSVQNVPHAKNIKYDNTKSKLASADVQGAIDEVAKHDYRTVNINGREVQEWINPWMKLGDEYRLAERFMGKPVYKKLIKFTFELGYNPNETYTFVDDSIDMLIEYGGFTSVDNPTEDIPKEVHCVPCRDVTMSCHYRKENNEVEMQLQVDNQYMQYGSYAADSCYVWFKYTKTTDSEVTQ